MGKEVLGWKTEDEYRGSKLTGTLVGESSGGCGGYKGRWGLGDREGIWESSPSLASSMAGVTVREVLGEAESLITSGLEWAGGGFDRAPYTSCRCEVQEQELV